MAADSRFDSGEFVPAAVGFFGKLPSHGDFISRGVADVFLNCWDAWLQRVLVGSRTILGDDWLSTYLTSPIWRFALAEHIAGGAVWMGILLPSVDRVGRYFPMTFVAEYPPGLPYWRLAQDWGAWFDEMEALALTALDQSDADVEMLASRLAGVAATLSSRAVELPTEEGRRSAWAGPMRSVNALHAAIVDGVATRAQLELSPVSLWWTSGSDSLRPQWRAQQGLPTAATYAEMLGSGSMSAVDSNDGDLPTSRSSHVDSMPSSPRVWNAAGVTHPGHVRANNEDAWLSRPDVGCWLVADGMGGHERGEWASRRTVENVNASIGSTHSLDTLILAVRRGLEDANAELRHFAHAERLESGSTIVALLAIDADACVIWAGDSRLYRVRRGQLTRLTKDHVAEHDSNRPASEITRAIGGADLLELDEMRFSVEQGDRFLMCSDGVHGNLSDEEIERLMGLDADPQLLTDRVCSTVLQGRAPDNLTAVVLCVS